MQAAGSLAGAGVRRTLNPPPLPTVFSRAQLLDSVREDIRDVSDRAIDSHVKNLRRKIQAVKPAFENIVSLYGVGYRFDVPLCA
jgi:DNA-binding response OmpR family regulator